MILWSYSLSPMSRRNETKFAAGRSSEESQNGPTSKQESTMTTFSQLDLLWKRLIPWTTAIVWPLLFTVPLLLSSPSSPWHYSRVFAAEWYQIDPNNDSPKPLGLFLGIFAVAVGQVWVWIIFYLFKYGYLSSDSTEPVAIQTKGARPYAFMEGLKTHIAQPEGFVLLGAYLSITWMFRLMPNSYYSFQGTIQWPETFLCLVIQDGIQFTMHYLEHVVSPSFYQMSHKPHHRFTNPRMFDAFNGSVWDTVIMILIPLYLTANIVRNCNVWTYMAFGSSYANWLTLIHSEYAFPWDGAFQRVGFGTPADHHVHHKVFKFNYGHLFMWLDQLAGTYRDPKTLAPKLFNNQV